MSDVIDKLIEKHFSVSRIVDPGAIQGGTADTLKKFAHDVVQECVDVSMKTSHREDDMGSIIAKKIQKHFGIEKDNIIVIKI